MAGWRYGTALRSPGDGLSLGRRRDARQPDPGGEDGLFGLAREGAFRPTLC
jgi:hypothetical protein